jgi:hypothetical protein
MAMPEGQITFPQGPLVLKARRVNPATPQPDPAGPEYGHHGQ